MAMTASTSVAGAGSLDPAPATKHRRERIPLRQQLIGYLFVSPWVLFFVGIFAYPLGFAVWMSFYDYFFAAPGATVERPFVGFDNYWAALTDEDVRQSFYNIAVFLVINVPLTVILAMALAMALNAVIPFRAFFRTAFFLPYVTASVALDRRLAVVVQNRRARQQRARPPGPRPVVARQRTAGDADDRHLRHVEGTRHVHPAVPRRLAERAEGALRSGRGGRRRTLEVVPQRHVAGRAAGDDLGAGAGDHHRRQLVHRAVPAHRGRWPQRRVIVSVLIMYQRGIQQGNAGEGAAIGVILVILVGIVGLAARHLSERNS